MIDIARTKIPCSAGILALVILLFGGCGEIAYKRGANSSDLETAKKTCREQWADSAVVEKCMADSGWIVQNLKRIESLDADPVVDASVIPSNVRIENAASATPGNRGSEKFDSAQSSTSVKKKPDMLDTFKISSWWKTGSGADSLQSDTAACVATLGEAHRSNHQTQTASRGLLLCMKEKGWSGLRAQ